jgi:hypothetical protein
MKTVTATVVDACWCKRPPKRGKKHTLACRRERRRLIGRSWTRE